MPSRIQIHIHRYGTVLQANEGRFVSDPAIQAGKPHAVLRMSSCDEQEDQPQKAHIASVSVASPQPSIPLLGVCPETLVIVTPASKQQYSTYTDAYSMLLRCEARGGAALAWCCRLTIDRLINASISQEPRERDERWEM
jgi:hypothetical protein